MQAFMLIQLQMEASHPRPTSSETSFQAMMVLNAELYSVKNIFPYVFFVQVGQRSVYHQDHGIIPGSVRSEGP